jgi:hypothetical protein
MNIKKTLTTKNPAHDEAKKYGRYFKGDFEESKILRRKRGRILRPSEGKKPLVIDFMDARVGLLRYRAKQRWK